MLVEFLLGMAVLFALVWLIAPPGVPWASQLTRLNAGVAGEAEWTAPRDVQMAVAADYRAAQAWLAAVESDYGLFARQAHKYASGAHLFRQRAALNSLVEGRGPRLAARLEAEHQIVVRRFSGNGLNCLLIDRQTERIMFTETYWNDSDRLRQRLPDEDLVWEMRYDLLSRVWKTHRFVQALPRASGAGSRAVKVTLTATLPRAAGRDS